MTSEQRKGQIREALIAAAGILTAWGVSDGHGWMPVVALLMALYCLGAAVQRHIRRGEGAVAWSLIRKTINAAGAGAATYGLLTQGQADQISSLAYALGPIIASASSWISNGPGPKSGGKLPILIIGLIGMFALPSCNLSVTPDGCLLGEYQRGGQTYRAGPCFGESLDGDPEIDRYRVRWSNEQGRSMQATYTLESSSVQIESRMPDGTWFGWSSKSGITIDPLPEPVANALAGRPEPVGAQSEPVALIP